MKIRLGALGLLVPILTVIGLTGELLISAQEPDQVAGTAYQAVPYGPAEVLQEDVAGATIELAPAYADGYFTSFYILKEEDNYYMWLGSRRGTGPNFNSIEQWLESQDGLLWKNRTDTNLVWNSSSWRYLSGIRQVIKSDSVYEGWEQYWWEAIYNGGWARAIRYLTSKDGRIWTVVNQPALKTGYRFTVIKKADTYHLWTSPHVDVRFYSDRNFRYHTSNNGGTGWGDWRTGGSLVEVDSSTLDDRPIRVRPSNGGDYELFYVDGSGINLATSSDGVHFTTLVTELLNFVEILPSPAEVTDFMVLEVNGQDWFYIMYCTNRDSSGSCIDSRVAITRPLPELEISKEGPEVAIVGEPITYTLTISNVGGSPATDLIVADTIPDGAGYVDGSGGNQAGNVVTWDIPTLLTNTTAVVQFAVTATETITNDAFEVTGEGYGTVGEDAVVTVVSEQAVPESLVYLPVILSDYRMPVSFPVPVGDAIAKRNVAYQGELFYITSFRMPAELSAGGRFYFSSRPDRVAEVLVDDKLVMLLGENEIFSYNFSTGGRPAPAIVEVPRATMEQVAGRTVRVEYRDVYGALVESSEIWLIWVP